LNCVVVEFLYPPSLFGNLVENSHDPANTRSQQRVLVPVVYHHSLSFAPLIFMRILESSVLVSPIVLATATNMLKGEGDKSSESDDDTVNKQQRTSSVENNAALRQRSIPESSVAAATTMTAALASSAQSKTRSRPFFVKKVTSNDVLMGRGAITDNHEGNKRFRELVRQRKQEYNLTSRHQTKQEISNHIVATIKNRGGAFLRKIESAEESDNLGVPTGTVAWTHASDDVIHLKVKQALRDKNSMKEIDSRQQTTSAAKMAGSGVGKEIKQVAVARKASPNNAGVSVSASSRKDNKAAHHSGAKRVTKENHPSTQQVTLLGESRLLPTNDRRSLIEQSLLLSSQASNTPPTLASIGNPSAAASLSGNSSAPGQMNIPYASPSLTGGNTSSFLASLSQQRMREQQQLEESILASSRLSSTGCGNHSDLYSSVAYQQLLRRLVLQQSELELVSGFGNSNSNVLEYLRLLNDPALGMQQQQMIHMQQQRTAAAAALANPTSQQRTFSGSMSAANDDLLLEQQLANLVRLRNQFPPSPGTTTSTVGAATGTIGAGAEQPTNQNVMSHQSQSSTLDMLLASSNNIRNSDLTLPNRRLLPTNQFGEISPTSRLGGLNVLNQRSLAQQLDHQNPHTLPGIQQPNLSDMISRFDNSNNDDTKAVANTGSQLKTVSISGSNSNFGSPKKLASPFMTKKRKDDLADELDKVGPIGKSTTSSPQSQSKNMPLKASLKLRKKRASGDLSSSSSSSSNRDGSTAAASVNSNKRLREK
jgi:hypothetical protein